MRKVPFKDLPINRRFFDITQNGDEFIKISWTHARRIRDGKDMEFLKNGQIYIKGSVL